MLIQFPCSGDSLKKSDASKPRLSYCFVCDEEFSSANELDQHIDRTHKLSIVYGSSGFAL